MSLQRIILDTKETKAQMEDLIPLKDAQVACDAAATHIIGLGAGIKEGQVRISLGAVQAQATVTFTGAPTAAETLSIANVVLTARASGAVANEFNIGGSVTITAANLAAAINASTQLADIVTATSLAGVVTITAKVPGKLGNGLQLSEGLSNTTAVAFAGGAEGTESLFIR